MTKLLTEELVTTLNKEVTLVSDRVMYLKGIRPLLVMINAPSGTFTMTMKAGATELASVSFTSDDIKSDLNTTDNYAYLYKALEFTNAVPIKSGTYNFELSSSGYTFDASSMIGWAKKVDDIWYDIDGVIENETNYPLTMEIWENKRVIYA